MVSRSDSAQARTSDEAFVWNNDRYESVVEQRTGIVASWIDRIICFGLLLFGVGGLFGAVAMAWMHLLHP